MSSVGSFGTFTTARLAIYVSQKGLSVTGNNIANINTVGYTRQRLDQVSFKTGASDRYQNSYDMRVGNGAIPKSVSQLRDPYLDVRYRAEHSSEGFYSGKLNGLDQIATILDEIGAGKNSKGEEGDGLIHAQLSDFFKSLQHLQTSSGTEVNDTLVFNSADALCKLFYSGADRLERLRTNTETQLRQEVNDINDILVSIRKLNESIQQAEIFGDNALELRDERNNFIDDLSEKLKIHATYSMVDVGGKMVEKLTIRLGNANPDEDVKSDSSILVDGNYCAQLTTPKVNTANDGFAYVNENGEGTNDPRAAAQVFDEHYNITVTDLRDKNNKEWVDYPDVRDTYVKSPLDQDFPTKAKYIGTFSFSGTWKDGDTINANGVTVKIGPAETPAAANTVYLSADGANSDAKNVSNAIRKALMASGNFNDYDITTKTVREVVDGTEKFNVQLTVKAKEPGAKTGDLPEINISSTPTANPQPTLTIGGVEEAKDKNGETIEGQYTAKITAAGNPNKFHKGDTITIGTNPSVTLKVGDNISVNAANDPERLAAKLAGKMNIEGYTVTSKTDEDGNAYLVFKANKSETPETPDTPPETPDTPPETQAETPANAPTVPTVTAKAADPATFVPATLNGVITNGTDAKGDAVDLMNAPAKIEDNGDNTTSKIITSYYMDDNDKWHEVVKTITTSKDKTLDDNDLFGELQAIRELLTEEGEFASQDDIDRDESAAIKRGIPFYQHTLDLLARQFAETMNEANTGFAVDQEGNYLDEKGNVLKLEDGTVLNKAGSAEQKAAVEANALLNYINANCAGIKENDEGENVLVDKYGNPLKLGGTELTLDKIKIAGTDTPLTDAKIDENGKLVDAGGDEIEGPLEFTDDAFGTVPEYDDPTDEEKAAIKAAEAEIEAKSKAAEDDMNKQALDSYLALNGGNKLGGNLFSIRGDTDDAEGITALNISVSDSWSKGLVHVVPTYTKLFGGGENGGISNTTENDNALHMGHLMEKALVYNPQDLIGDAASNHLFEGTFAEMFVKMDNTLGNDQRSTSVSLQTHTGQALDIDTSRDSVSAVDLNDEAMDLMQYSHSLNAAYRLMTTLDEMLERLITGTGVTR